MAGALTVSLSAERISQPSPDLSDVDRIVRRRSPAIVLVVIVSARILVDHQGFGLIDLVVVAPIRVERDVNSTLLLRDQTADAPEGEPRHHLLEIDDLQSPKVIGVGSVDHKKV